MSNRSERLILSRNGDHDAQRISVAVVHRQRDNSVLMIKRRTCESGITWALPGGKVEEGERFRPELTAKREVFEETGIRCYLHNCEKIGARSHPKTGVDIYYYLFFFGGGVKNVRPEEAAKISSVAWCTVDQVKERLGPSAYPKLIEMLPYLGHRKPRPRHGRLLNVRSADLNFN